MLHVTDRRGVRLSEAERHGAASGRREGMRSCVFALGILSNSKPHASVYAKEYCLNETKALLLLGDRSKHFLTCGGREVFTSVHAAR